MFDLFSEQGLKFNRRGFLQGGAVLIAGSAVPGFGLGGAFAGSETKGGAGLTIAARRGVAELLEKGGPKADIWGYDGLVPGPVLRMRQGETLNVRFVNELPQPSTIHWHGVRIENAFDGVAGLTQEAVPPGGTFDYRITAPDAGTYWYHPHNRSWEQLARGLYGVLIVEEPGEKSYDREMLLVFDDWRLGEDGKLDEASFGNLHDWSHQGVLGNVLTTNGKPFWRETARPGERLRLRIVNTANARIFALRFAGLSPRVIALDGQPVVPYALESESLTIAPSQRIDLIVDVPAAERVFVIEEISGRPFAAGELSVSGASLERSRALGEDIALPQNPLNRSLSLGDALAVDLLMEGGAMGGLRQARLHGELKDIRDLAGVGKVWAFNGVAGDHGDQALFTAARGRTVTMPIINDTNWPHAIHIHGHHFKVMARDGKPVSADIWHDTVLTDPGERVDIAFVADNPGKWMIHCHMLEHQAAGMSAWFEVA